MSEKRNAELLEQVMQFIVDNPERHRQTTWFRHDRCGTAACFAGWACMLSGKTEEWMAEHFEWGPVNGISLLAGDLLGLTDSEQSYLFYQENTVPMLQLMVKDLVNGDELRSRQEYWEQARQDA
jgi:hypothetical protein